MFKVIRRALNVIFFAAHVNSSVTSASNQFLSWYIRQAPVSSETNVDMLFPLDRCICDRLTLRVISNTSLGTLTLRTRLNGADANLVIVVPAGINGSFFDNVNQDTYVRDDLIDMTLINSDVNSVSVITCSMRGIGQ